MTASERTSYPIVGARHHPPALALLSVLPTGTNLTLKPEPTNAFDPNAIQVLVPGPELKGLNSKAHTILEEDLPGYGLTVEELLAKPEVMLGYIARNFAETLAPTLEGKETSATLAYNSQGEPRATLNDEEGSDDAQG